MQKLFEYENEKKEFGLNLYSLSGLLNFLSDLNAFSDTFIYFNINFD
jgi:hypothetical protein